MKSSGEIKLFIGILVGAVVLSGVAFGPLLIGQPPKPPEKYTPPPNINRTFLIPKDSHIWGNPNAPNSLVEFSDMECPHCKDAVPVIQKALDKYKDKVNLVFHHFKAARSHEHTQQLAYVAEAAGKQGKFFEMVDILYKNQELYAGADETAIRKLGIKFADDLKLDLTKFQKDLDSDDPKHTYQRDNDMGEDAKVTQTPFFFFVSSNGTVTALMKPEVVTDWFSRPANIP